MSLVEKRLGVRFQIERCLNWDEVLAKAGNHEVDFLSAAAQTPDREDYLLFSSPHIVLPGVIITRKETAGELNLDNIQNRKVSIVSGYVWEEFISRDHPEITLDPVRDVQTGLKNVSFGYSDIFIENLATATYTIEKLGITNLRLAGETGYFTRLSFATRTDWPELNSILEKGLLSITAEEKKTIYRKWIRLEQGGIFNRPEFRLALFIGAGAAVLAILLFFVWNHSLRRRVALRTEQLKQELAERSKVESALRESEEKFILMVENANSIILRMDPSGMVTYFNRFAEQFFGFSREEIIGRNVVGTIVPPHDTTGENLEARMREIGNQPEKYTVSENENIRKNGEHVWVAWSNKPIFDKAGIQTEILSVGNDITALRHAQEALKKERDFNEAIFDTAGALVVVFDTKARIVRFNHTCEQITGYAFDEVKGKTIWELFLIPEETAQIQKVFDNLVAGIFPNQAENFWKCRGGHLRLIAWYNTAILDKAGEVHYIISSGIDITEHRKAEKELERHHQHTQELVEQRTGELKKTVTLLEAEIAERSRMEKLAARRQQELIQADKMASIGILVSGVAHEINNPNNFIILNSDNLRDIWRDVLPVLDEYSRAHSDFTVANLEYADVRNEVAKFISGISGGAQRIRTIVQSLKDFARQGSDDMDCPVNCNAVIEQANIILANLIKKSTNRFIVENDPDLPDIRGNFQRIEQVVINLIANACQALSDRSKTVTVGTYFIREDNRVVIKVRDEGAGISAENLKHLMDPFFTTKRDSGGTGLGLAISYGIVIDHGGKLTIDSEEGKGTIVTVSFPVGNEQEI